VTKVGRRIDVVFLGVLFAALGLRLPLASTRPYVHDEENAAIPLAHTISFTRGQLNLPIRGENHGALPAYVVKASSTLFGSTPPAYRSLHVLLGLGAVALIYFVTNQWYGRAAARWAAALFAFNEYFLDVSTRATAHAPYLFFVASAVAAFSQFLRAGRPAYLYAAGLFVGLAFYCKEHSALLLPVFLAVLLLREHRHWLRRPHAYLACATFALVIAPDVVWNVARGSEMPHITRGNELLAQATYSSHLRRLGGIGLSPYPLMFYARSSVQSMHVRMAGSELVDGTPEYRSVDPVLGALLLGAVVVTTLRRAQPHAGQRFLLIMFWGVFGFFTFVEKGNPPGRLDPVSWIWVEATIIPAAVLTGARLADMTGTWRVAAWGLGAVVLLSAGASFLLP
jgi:4-amino-4-deoxy-L-arabinose transferase-like glycosyltransferase